MTHGAGGSRPHAGSSPLITAAPRGARYSMSRAFAEKYASIVS